MSTEHRQILQDKAMRPELFFPYAQELLDRGLADRCLTMLDIEHFKLYNKWYGRDAGDRMIGEIGAELLNTPDTVVCYLGQDDFCFLMPLNEEKIDQLYQRIHRIVASRGVVFGFLPALGICPTEPGDNILDAFDKATLAMQTVKGNYRSRIRFFSPDMLQETEDEYRLLLNFQAGLEKGEFFFELQPQCELSSHQVVGAEALARWHSTEGTLIPPLRFIPTLEKYGLITDLDQYIWEQVCRWLRGWLDAGHQFIPISVNVSKIDIISIDVPAYFERLITRYRLPVSAIKIEITESAYADSTDEIQKAVQRLRALGFAVLMDDFGSGSSSLNMLCSLNFDTIKIDARFLCFSDADSKKGLQILESVITMTKDLNLPIIVEGVETPEQAEFLSHLGCCYIQGFLFYCPMSVEKFEELFGTGGSGASV